MSASKERWANTKKKLSTFLLESEGGKLRLNKRRATYFLIPAGILALAAALYPWPKDTSFVGRSKKQAAAQQDASKQSERTHSDAPQMPKGIAWGTSETPGQSPEGKLSSKQKLRAAQVVVSTNSEPGGSLPTGTTFVGKLLTALDTRMPTSLVKIAAPYGASFDHERRIDRDAVLFGTASYPGTGEKVFVKVTRVRLPNGGEFKLEGEVLSAADYSPGIVGNEHDGAENRMVANLGLSMLSGVTGAMVEREALTPFGEPTVKSNIKNAFVNGITKSAEQEGGRMAGKLNDTKTFVTVEAGRELIVTLTDSFKREAL